MAAIEEATRSIYQKFTVLKASFDPNLTRGFRDSSRSHLLVQGYKLHTLLLTGKSSSGPRFLIICAYQKSSGIEIMTLFKHLFFRLGFCTTFGFKNLHYYVTGDRGDFTPWIFPYWSRPFLSWNLGYGGWWINERPQNVGDFPVVTCKAKILMRLDRASMAQR